MPRISSKHLLVSLLLVPQVVLQGFTQEAHAKAVLPTIFSDGMVLQQGPRTNIWGKASPGEHVTVRFDNQLKETAANAQGDWLLSLTNLKPTKNSELAIEASNKLIIKNVQVGDVWFCSGQSNMNLPVEQTDSTNSEIVDLSQIDCRIFQADYKESKVNLDSAPGKWLRPAPSTVKTMPAIPLMMAGKLSNVRHVAIGMIVSACAGTPLQSFLAPETAAQLHATPPVLPTKYGTSSIFRTMIYPFLRCSVSGIVWYQGESNILDYERYKSYFPVFITALRKEMAQGDLPFYFVQLPNYGTKQNQPADSFWTEFRESQTVALTLPNTCMIVAIDTAKDSSLHPKSKKEIASRLAEAIQADRAKDKLRIFVPKTVQAEDDLLVLDFGSPNVKFDTTDGYKPTGFQIAGADRRFFPAEVVFTNNKIKLQSDDVLEPVAARYAWKENPDCNISVNAMPLAPFRTDKWKTSPQLNASTSLNSQIH